MAISARLLLLITFAIFTILSLSVYIYSKNYKNQAFFNIKFPSSNGTKPASDKIAEQTVQKGNLGFVHAFIASISVIVVSELGDKTFFIAAILAMRHSRLVIYTGAMSALGAMTILSALLGNIVTKFVSRVYTYYLSSILFAGFGVKMLKDGYGMSADEGTEEYEEVQNEVEKAEAKEDGELDDGETADNSSRMNQPQQRLSKRNVGTFVVAIIRRYISPIFIQAFIMTFLAEWGDRSQITTIVLAASENLLGVIVGGTIGHGLCTGLAVLGGRFVAQRISPKTVTLVGGVVFLIFALSAFFIRPDK
ncbi:unnamed protein product [Adineta ricciae]|uniref:GDT1 family protein n=1 Tax=Adineta ricciae TaxID=249248 RepID=A0A813VA97_ADIRI|nr:unnamed protein product [Adineta ricciae]